MGYVVRVEADRVAAAAAQLTRVQEDLERAGGVLADVLRSVSGAAGAGTLAVAADAAAREWQGGMVRVARHGHQLALATARAAEAYRAVELLNTRVWGRLPALRGTP